MKNTKKLITLLLVAITLNSCVVSGVQGSKNVTTENRVIKSDFEGIKVSMGIEVQLTQGETTDIEVEMDDNIHELLITEVKEGVLHIYFDEQVGYCKQKMLHISMPNIKKLTTSSGAAIRSQNEIATIELVLNSSSGSNLNIEADATRIDCDASSGANVTLKGICKNLYINASSGSSINATNLETTTVKVGASSGANIKVYASSSLDANTSSGGSISCKGNPEQKSINKSSGGNIHVE